MATLNTRIALFAGHDMPEDFARVEWIGTIGELRAESPDWLDGDTLQECLDALDAHGCWRYGGGAGQAFIALKVEPVGAPRAACPFNGHRPLEGVAGLDLATCAVAGAA